MTNMIRCGTVCGSIIILFFASAVAHASITTITLDVSPDTPTSGNYSAGDLVEIIIRASSDGNPGQGFSGADFLTGDLGIFVDTSKVKIHDIKGNGTFQVDTEAAAISWDISDPNYSMADDTWVYDDLTDFTGDVIMADGSFEAVAGAQIGSGFDLGIAAPVNFLHVVFEIQPGFVLGESTDVTFKGQVGAYGQELGDEVWSNIFDELTHSDVATGSCSLTLTPEPTTALLLLAGIVVPVVRRKR